MLVLSGVQTYTQTCSRKWPCPRSSEHSGYYSTQGHFYDPPFRALLPAVGFVVGTPFPNQPFVRWPQSSFFRGTAAGGERAELRMRMTKAPPTLQLSRPDLVQSRRVGSSQEGAAGLVSRPSPQASPGQGEEFPRSGCQSSVYYRDLNWVDTAATTTTSTTTVLGQCFPFTVDSGEYATGQEEVALGPRRGSLNCRIGSGMDLCFFSALKPCNSGQFRV